MAAVLSCVGTDAQNSFEDLSGFSPVSTPLKARSGNYFSSEKAGGKPSETQHGSNTVVQAEGELANPYDVMIDMCEADPARISQGYSTHRKTRNAKFSAILRSPETAGPTVDRTLVNVLKTKAQNLPVDDSVDPRNCLVFWARPPQRIREFVRKVQDELRKLAPEGLWFMPSDCLHMTVLEISHSVSPEEVQRLEDKISPSIEKILKITLDHQAKIVQPLISFDAAALAISFIPSPALENAYTYHHLRRDLYGLCTEAGVPVQSRYILPSAHITLGRFIDDAPLKGRMTEWVEGIEKINERLASESQDVSWTVGEEKGIVLRRGRLWYGGGEDVHAGEGF